MEAPLLPDPKAGVAPLPPGSEACGCCEGVDASTPQRIVNRDGLGAIGYRIGAYAQFRDSLRAGLSQSAFAPLARLLTRDDDDFTIALIDAFACSADVLSFYQERIANESWLRTATERVSLQELGRLIGYGLRPGLAAETWLAFAIETPPAAPPTLALDPGAFVTGVPAEVRLEAGLKVQSVPGPNEKPQTFETVEAVDARAAWNAMRPWLSVARRPGRDARETWLDGVRNNLKPGDALLFVGDEYLARADNDNWDFRLIDGVATDDANQRTRVSWKRGLGSLVPWSDPSTQQPQVHVLRKRAAPFGHNAPMWKSMSDPFRVTYATTVPGSTAGQDEWPGYRISAQGATAVGGPVDLDALYPEIGNGSYVVLAKGEFNRPGEGAPPGTYVELYTVASVSEVSRAAFALAAKSTRLQLVGEHYADKFAGFVRETGVFAQSERLDFARYPVDDEVAGDRVPVSVAPAGLAAGRRLIVRGLRASDGVALLHRATLVAAHADVEGAVLEIAPPLPAALRRASVVVHANVALASHGETVSQILGAGDAGQAFQRFELRQLPLTWRSAGNELGAEPALTVRVNDIAWAARASLYGAAPGERVYALQTDEQGRQWLQFGDGSRGARLPGGTNNVRAVYRKGLGAEGNVRAEALTQLASRPLGLKSVANPGPAEGGTDPEPAGEARRTMPLGTRTLGRAVSLLDYEDFARAYTGVAKAQARVLQLPGGPTIAVTIAGPDNAELGPDNPVWQHLAAALKLSGDPHVRVRLLPHAKSTFRLGLKVKRDAAYELKPLLAGVEAALRAHFAFDARELAQAVQQSELIAVAHRVPGVVAVDLDLLYGGSAPVAQTARSRQVRLLASRMRVQGGVALAAEMLTLDAAPFERLEEMT